MSNLQQRVISGVVMAVVVLGLTWLGGSYFRLLAAAIALAVFYEWSAMSRTAANAPFHLFAAFLLVVVVLALVAGFPVSGLWLGLFAAIIVTAAVGALRGQDGWNVAGLAYAGISGLSLALLRGADKSGLVAILFLFAVVWATDIIAYFVGRAVGGPKLAPAISPGKTWSGAVGGTVGGLVAGTAVALAASTPHLGLTVAAALLLSVMSQIGDLFESWVKRRHGVKDSSHLIPGHGGVMDRVDGLVVAAFALYLIGTIFGGAENPAGGLFPL